MLFFIYFVCWNSKWHSVAYHVPFFTTSNFYTVLICPVHTVHIYKITQYCHNFNSIYISTEGGFFMCERYTELERLVVIFSINMGVENISRRLWLNTSSCSRLAINARSFFNLNFIVCCVVLWTCHLWLCEVSNCFVISVASLWFKKTSMKHYGFHYKSGLRLFWCEDEIKISHELHTRYVMFVYRIWGSVLKAKRKHSDLVSLWYGGSKQITVMIVIFAVAMLRVTTLKIRQLPCTWTFLQFYALLFMA
jgi:hypothetical protein